jgi:hypothetical protein
MKSEDSNAHLAKKNRNVAAAFRTMNKAQIEIAEENKKMGSKTRKRKEKEEVTIDLLKLEQERAKETAMRNLGKKYMRTEL